ncbi:hypothetical protein [Hydrogenothermus marinus]|uniref:Lipoprotein n=1 Tax=Hydrogenothermus marinus TaxID=133270 RepID=A0A3M0BRE3_9AQUI|nr:hypothetical protein [Hydrogenothermus marinus]RMB00064.1 hypothetical protein CLV39_0033 [Hydrogenothermus marinus]
MKKKALTLAVVSSVFITSCGELSKQVNPLPQIKQASPVAEYLYSLNRLNSNKDIYFPISENEGYLWDSGYEAYLNGKVSVSWQLYLSTDLKKICKAEGGKMVRIISPAEGFEEEEEITDDTIKIGDTCKTDKEKIFLIEDIIKGRRYYPSGAQASWQPIIIKIWHKDKVVGARTYSQMIKGNPEWKGKKATEIFGPDKISEVIWKMQGFKARYKSFVENIADIDNFGLRPDSWEMINDFASFCKANNGTLYINGRTLDEFFNYVVEEENLNYAGGQVFEGKYICKAENGFTALASLLPRMSRTSTSYPYKIIVKNQVEPVKRQQPITMKKANTTTSYQDEASDIALKVAESKSVYVEQKGSVSYIGYYNGKNGSCDLVSVKKKTGNQTDYILNYKVCNGKVERLPDTVLPAIPKLVKMKARGFAVACQRYGITEMNVNGFTLKCRPVRDYKECNVEVIYLENGRMLDREIINACNINVKTYGGKVK